MVSRLDRLLDLMEEHADLARFAEARELSRRALSRLEVPYPPLRVEAPCPEDLDLAAYPYSEIYDDPEKMLFNELVQHLPGLLMGDDRVCSVRAHYGVGILPSAFGRPVKLAGDHLPWVEHVDSTREIEEILERGRPALDAGLLAKCWAAYRYYRERLQNYPRLSRMVVFYHPDLQGPFNTALEIWGEGLYLAIYDNPDMVEALLRLITQTYLQVLEYYKTLAGEGNDFTAHWGVWMPGGAMIREDAAVTISPEMYSRFCQPYNREILARFGGAIHHCGRGAAFFARLIRTEGLAGLNFGQPELQDLPAVLRAAAEHHVALLDLSLEALPPEARPLARTGVSLSARAASIEEGRELIRRNREGWL